MANKTLTPPAGSITRKKILGRGTSSGKGRTSTKGHKGIKARAGGTVSMGFEGGQMKLIMRMPKVGFTNYPHFVTMRPIDVELLDRSYQSGEEVSLKTLREKKLVGKNQVDVKILGKGILSKKLTIAKGIHASASAKKVIETAGGTFAA
ncbi:MAG: 50S ribosomal protein L15 [Spirochaetia bacterium]|nr:50S ribosomal protein L15 [Spirochaetia bacterium]